MTEWVEVKGTSVDVAVQAALAELGIDDADRASVEVLQEPEKGFLGIGGRDAIVRVKPKPARKRSRNRSGGDGRERSNNRSQDSRDRNSQDRNSQDRNSQGRNSGGRSGSSRSGKGGQERSRTSNSGSGGGGEKAQARGQKPGRSRQEDRGASGGNHGRGGQGGGKRGTQGNRSRGRDDSARDAGRRTEAASVDIEEQATVIQEFLAGLLDAFGLEGSATVRVEDDVIYADIAGEQTEALIGPKATILQAIHELTKTVVQRKTMAGTRLRLDVGGYAERRKEALTIYASRLAEQVISEDAEIMLEAMNPADRKTVHDAVSDIDGVRSYSEGEDPRRSVVLSPDTEGPRG